MIHRPRERPRHPDPGVDAAIDRLLELLPPSTQHKDLLRELVVSATRLPEHGLDRSEYKILSSTLRDFSRSFEVFGRHRDRKKVSLFGSARTPEGSPVYELARELAGALAAAGYMVITGAGPGIMRAGNQGAGRAASFGVSIDLPFEPEANDVIRGDEKLVHFKYFFTRKLSFVKESDAIVLFPGGLGTMDEGFEALTLLQTGKCDPLPLVLVDLPGSNYWPSWERYLRENLLEKGLMSPADRNLFVYTSSVTRAVQEIERFYFCYHSLRYVGDICLLRLRRRPTPALLATLNTRYRDLLASGDFELLEGPHRAEQGEPEEVRRLVRVGFHFVRRSFGRLRRLIDELNLGESEEIGAPPVPATPEGGHLFIPPDDGEGRG